MQLNGMRTQDWKFLEDMIKQQNNAIKWNEDTGLEISRGHDQTTKQCN